VSRRLDVWLAAGFVALGLALLLGARGISPGAGYDRIGPRFFPMMVAAGLILIGLVLALSALRHSPSSPVPFVSSWLRDERGAFAYLAAGLLLFLLLAERIGFIIPASLQFWLVARGFRSRRPARDAIVASVLSVIVYVVFSNVLGLSLPAGVIERFL
jgi:putative tricarboxylic transport membrane protein